MISVKLIQGAREGHVPSRILMTAYHQDSETILQESGYDVQTCPHCEMLNLRAWASVESGKREFTHYVEQSCSYCGELLPELS